MSSRDLHRRASLGSRCGRFAAAAVLLVGTVVAGVAAARSWPLAAVAGAVWAATAVAVCVWWWIRRRVQQPLQTATQALRRHAGSGCWTPLPVTGRDEVGQLMAAVNELLAAAFDGEAQVQGILTTAADGILTIDSLGLVERANPAAEVMFGLSGEDLTGSHVGVLIPSCEELPIAGLSLDPQIMAPGAERIARRRYELEGRHASGRTFPLSITVGRLPSVEETRHVLVLRDVRHQREAEEALRAAKESAEGMSRTKSEFLANMSHEIRTPMNGIIGLTDLALEDDQVRGDTREHLEAVRASADALLEIINDILDFSKIEAGRFDLERIDFDLRSSLDTALLPVRLRAREKGLNLDCHVADDVPRHLLGDPTRLRQVVTNLVSNAIKFTDRGFVRIEVRVESRDADRLVLHGSVQDTGIGIPTTRQAHIFESFTQADGSTTRRFGGTGLGLSICAQIVRLMDGRIWVDSEEGVGSTFHFLVRLGWRDAGPDPVAPTGPDVGPGQLLLVTDGRSRSEVAGDLRRRGWAVQCAEGIEGLLACLDGADPVDAILLDMALSDSFAVAASLHQRLPPPPPLLVVARGGQRGDAGECRRHGIAAYLNEATMRDELHEALLLVCGPEPPQELITRHTLREGRRALRVLLAEDNPVNQRLARELLQRAGHDVVIAGDGRQAVDLAATQSFDLVLMDVQMPSMDGLEATRAIRAREATGGGHLPIVAMTAHALSGDRQRCLEAGMDDYLTKPLHRQQFYDAITRWTGTSAPLMTPAGASAPASGPPADTGQDAPVFDRVAALDRMAGDEDLLAELIEAFLEEAPRQMERLRRALAAGDAGGVERCAHTLKGAAANLGAERVRKVALQVETAGRAGQLDTAATGTRQLGAELAHLSALLGG